MSADARDRGVGDDLRTAATEVVRALVDAGHVAYFAGGCVRDRLLGLAPKDYDVATDARPEQVRTAFPRAQRVGEAFGVHLVRRQGHMIEVATFRTDGPYADGRHPDEVSFTDAEHDAQRRDFTINGLFENPLDGEIIDYVNGRADLEARLVRAIGDPAARLREDELRMLRAVRFAARFQFALESDTAETIRAQSHTLRGVSRERIGQELRWMFTDRNRAVAAWEIQYLGLDHTVLDEDSRIAAPLRLARLPDRTDFATALSAWLLDRHEDGQTDLGAIADRWGRALKLAGAEHAGMRRSLDAYRVLRGPWRGLGVAAQKRLASSEGFEPGLLLMRAEDAQAFVDIRRHVLALAETGLTPEPLINGDDLIAHGMTPGPDFKRILDAVYDAQLESSISTAEEALSLAKTIRATDT